MVSQHADAAVANVTLNRAESDSMATPIDTALSETPAPPARGRRAYWLLAAIIAGYLIHVGWRIVLARHLYTPGAHADEDGYLLAARALVGGPGGSTMDNSAFRRVGYPMLISPVYWFSQDPFVVYRSVLVLNSLFNALVFPLAYFLARRTLAMPQLTALGAAFVAALLPAVVFYTQFALTDAVLATIVMTWLVLIHQWVTARTTPGQLVAAFGAGAVAGFLYVVHVRGTVIVFAHLLVIVALVVTRRTRWGAAGAAVLGAAAAMTLDPILKAVIGDAIVPGGSSPSGQTVDAVTTLSGLGRMLGTAEGMWWYMFVATFGLGAIGMIVAVRPLLRWKALRAELAEPVTAARRIVITTTLAITLMIALSSGAALPPEENRLNFYAYPRYIQLLFPLWLLIGLAALLKAESRKHAVRLAAGGAALTIATGLIVWIRLRVHGGGMFVAFDAPETSFLGWKWTQIGVVRPTAAGLFALAVILVLLWWRPSERLARLGLPAVLAVIALLATANAYAITRKISNPMVANQYRRGTPKLVEAGYVHKGDTVAFDQNQFLWYLKYNHSREIYWTSLIYFDSKKDSTPPASADVVIAPYDVPDQHNIPDWDGAEYGFTFVVEDINNHWAVWRRN